MDGLKLCRGPAEGLLGIADALLGSFCSHLGRAGARLGPGRHMQGQDGIRPEQAQPGLAVIARNGVADRLSGRSFHGDATCPAAGCESPSLIAGLRRGGSEASDGKPCGPPQDDHCLRVGTVQQIVVGVAWTACEEHCTNPRRGLEHGNGGIDGGRIRIATEIDHDDLGGQTPDRRVGSPAGGRRVGWMDIRPARSSHRHPHGPCRIP